MRESKRQFLLRQVRDFRDAASKVPGVIRIALIGSLTTEKADPKDADVLVTIEPSTEIEDLATIGRRLKGRTQSINSGADIFLCTSDGEYLGRTCSFKDCHPRRRCEGRDCAYGTYLCNDLHLITLKSAQIMVPALVIWPKFESRGSIPEDVVHALQQESKRW